MNEEKMTTTEKQILLVSRLMVYMAAIAMIGVFIYLSLSNHADIFMNIMKFRSVITLLTIVFIVDAIILNLFYKKNVIMIVFAWVLNFIYPWMRERKVKGSNVGKVLTVGIIASIIGMTGTFFSAYTTYGAGTLLMEKEADRHIVAECLDQELSDGEKLGKTLFKSFDVKQAEVKENEIILTGVGIYTVDDKMFTMTEKTIPTVLTYEKGSIKLSKVSIKEQELDESLIEVYERKILKD